MYLHYDSGANESGILQAMGIHIQLSTFHGAFQMQMEHYLSMENTIWLEIMLITNNVTDEVYN